MKPEIREQLAKEEIGEFHQGLLTKLNTFVKLSQDGMNTHRGRWQDTLVQYAATRGKDKQDQKATRKKEPMKNAIRLTASQVQTFAAFMFVQFLQRPKFFELKPTGVEDWIAQDTAETILQRDCNKSGYVVQLLQWLVDIGRFNLGVWSTDWRKDTTAVNVVREVEPTITETGEVVESVEEIVEQQVLTKYEGNVIKHVDPFRWLPDTRKCFAEFQEGEFCGEEIEVSRGWLKDQEMKGLVVGVDWVNDYTSNEWKTYGRDKSQNVTLVDPTNRRVRGETTSTDKKPSNYLLTKLYIRIIPKDFKINEEPIDKGEHSQLYCAWLLNNKRVIRFEPLDAYHDEFPYSSAQTDPDKQAVLAKSLSEVANPMQAIVSWLVNSRMLNVRRHLDHQIIFDSDLVGKEQLTSRQPFIPAKPDSRKSLRDSVMQLQVSDVTQNNFADIDSIMRYTYLQTGITENMQGQIASGRRSALEHRLAHTNSTTRLKMFATVIFNMGLSPMARQMLINSRQALSRESFDKIVGVGVTQEQIIERNIIWEHYHASAEQLVGSEDFFVLDENDPNDKAIMSQNLTELLKVLLSVPELIGQLDIDLKTMVHEIMLNNGSGDLERFSASMSQTRLQTMVQEAMAAQRPTAPVAAVPSVVPEPSTPPSAVA